MTFEKFCIWKWKLSVPKNKRDILSSKQWLEWSSNVEEDYREYIMKTREKKLKRIGI